MSQPLAVARQTFRQVQPPKTLEPKTPVRIVFRGGPPIVDKFDGQDIILPLEANEARLAGDPNWHRRFYEAVEIEGIEWQQAKHLKDRAIVPGTRNPYDGKKASYRLGISWTPTGQFVDKPEFCAPFTDAQLAHFDLPEGLDRKAFQDSRASVATLDTMSSISHVGNIHQTLNARPDDDDVAADGTEALRAIAGSASEGAAAGVESSRTRRGGVSRFKDDK